MNFDFLKDLCGLGHVYEDCKKAEELAAAMPAQSMLAASKSAELIARFIYMASHNQETEGVDFADVLSDATVADFVDNRYLIDALRSVAEGGNGEATAENAVAVLRDLQYVSGETACMLGLIDDYPLFDDQIGAFPGTEFADEENADEKAREMFLEYSKEFDAWSVRNQYMINEVFSYILDAKVEMHEYLKFDYKPKQEALIEYLQSYLLGMLRVSIVRLQKKESGKPDSTIFNAKVVIDGTTYSSGDKDAFIDAVAEKLPEANGFIIDLTAFGSFVEDFDGEFDKCSDNRLNALLKDAVFWGPGMLWTLQQYRRRIPFEYKLSAYLPGSDSFRYEKISDYKNIDVMSTCTYSDDLLDADFDEGWWSSDLGLYAEFDFEKHHDILMKLQDIVRSSIPEDEVKYCEEVWADGEFDLLCSGIQWCCSRMREVQDFLDKVNEVLLPIKDEVSAETKGPWEAKDHFAAATWVWTDEGFKVIGTRF